MEMRLKKPTMTRVIPARYARMVEALDAPLRIGSENFETAKNSQVFTSFNTTREL